MTKVCSHKVGSSGIFPFMFWVLFSAGLVNPKAQQVKNLPAMQQKTQEMWVQSLGWDDPLEEEMATHSNSLAWRIPWAEEPDRLQSMGFQRVRHDRGTNTLAFTLIQKIP